MKNMRNFSRRFITFSALSLIGTIFAAAWVILDRRSTAPRFYSPIAIKYGDTSSRTWSGTLGEGNAPYVAHLNERHVGDTRPADDN